jgi:hypothetical protein
MQTYAPSRKAQAPRQNAAASSNQPDNVKIYQAGDLLVAVYGTTYHNTARRNFFKYYDQTGHTGLATEETLRSWKLRSELVDFPDRVKHPNRSVSSIGAKPAEVPYVFQLLWQISTFSQLRTACLWHADKVLIRQTASDLGLSLRPGVRKAAGGVKPLIKRG